MNLLRAPRLALPLLALLAFGVAGCDNEDVGLDGEFVAAVTGDVLADYTGKAYYTVVDYGTGPVFVLLFFRGDLSDNNEDEYAYVALWRDGPQPGVGVYPIESTQTAPTAFAGSFTDLVDARSTDPEAPPSGPAISATSGILTVTTYDGSDLIGSFRFDGRGLFLPDTGTFIAASVDGTFEARYLPPGVLGSLGIDFTFE